MTATETVVVKDDAMTLDLLVWRRFKHQKPGLVERTLSLNPGLADMGVHIPVGTKVILPVEAPGTAPAQRPVVRLWD